MGFVLQAGSQMLGGIAEKGAADAEAKLYEQNAKQAKLAADQDEVLRREDLLSTLSTIRALRTARGLSPDSATGQVIDASVSREASRGIGTSRLNYLNQAHAYRTKAVITRYSGRMAAAGGAFQSAGTLFSGGLAGKK